MCAPFSTHGGVSVRFWVCVLCFSASLYVSAFRAWLCICACVRMCVGVCFRGGLGSCLSFCLGLGASPYRCRRVCAHLCSFMLLWLCFLVRPCSVRVCVCFGSRFRGGRAAAVHWRPQTERRRGWEDVPGKRRPLCHVDKGAGRVLGPGVPRLPPPHPLSSELSSQRHLPIASPGRRRLRCDLGLLSLRAACWPEFRGHMAGPQGPPHTVRAPPSLPPLGP